MRTRIAQALLSGAVADYKAGNMRRMVLAVGAAGVLVASPFIISKLQE